MAPLTRNRGLGMRTHPTRSTAAHAALPAPGLRPCCLADRRPRGPDRGCCPRRSAALCPSLRRRGGAWWGVLGEGRVHGFTLVTRSPEDAQQTCLSRGQERFPPEGPEVPHVAGRRGLWRTADRPGWFCSWAQAKLGPPASARGAALPGLEWEPTGFLLLFYS